MSGKVRLQVGGGGAERVGNVDHHATDMADLEPDRGQCPPAADEVGREFCEQKRVPRSDVVKTSYVRVDGGVYSRVRGSRGPLLCAFEGGAEVEPFLKVRLKLGGRRELIHLGDEVLIERLGENAVRVAHFLGRLRGDSVHVRNQGADSKFLSLMLAPVGTATVGQVAAFEPDGWDVGDHLPQEEFAALGRFRVVLVVDDLALADADLAGEVILAEACIFARLA